MAYGCPVCGEVHADGEHLANHLAVTAALHDDEHAAWLDEQVPDWPDRSPGELGTEVVDHAEERDVEGVSDPHARGEGTPEPSLESALERQGGRGRTRDRETERVLREARELTEQMEDAGSDEEADDAGSGG